MKYIKKESSPPEFEKWKEDNNPQKWEDLPSSPISDSKREPGVSYYSKKELKDTLLKEQGFICCYCNCRIGNDPQIAIDHIMPRDGDKRKELIFDYNNLSVSCKGGQNDAPPRTLHCDAFKKNFILPLHHLNENCEVLIKFNIDGKIEGRSDEAKDTIEKLNLNIAKLNNLRQAQIESFIFADFEANTLLSHAEIANLLEKISQKDRDNGKFIPYVSAVFSVLKYLTE